MCGRGGAGGRLAGLAVDSRLVFHRGNGLAGGGERLARDGRPKKTQEELDAEMEDYWGVKENGTEDVPVATDIDMIE